MPYTEDILRTYYL